MTTIKRSLLAVLSIIMAFSDFPRDADGGWFEPAAQLSADTGIQKSRNWKRVRSLNFEALGDADIGQIRTILSALETFRSVLATMFPGMRLTAPVPTLIVLLKTNSEFSRFKPRDESGHRQNYVGGYLIKSGDLNYIVLPAGGQDAHNPVKTAFHEYIHYISLINPSLRPVWLSEGISEFYSTFEYYPEQQRGLIGRPPEERLRSLKSHNLLPLAQVLGSDSAHKLIRNEKTASLFYAEAWALVHYLKMGRSGREKGQIEAYYNAIQQGVSIERAFRESFGVTFAEMELELVRYVQKPEFPAFYVSTPLESISTDHSTDLMSESEVLYVQGDLLARLGVYKDGEKMLAKAIKIQPSHTGARLALGAIRGHQKRYEEALELIRPISDREDTNFRSHLELARIYRAMEQLDNALLAYRRATDANPVSASGWSGRCMVAMESGRHGESDASLLRLEAIDLNPEWIAQRARAAYHANRLDIAARDASAYIEKAGLGAEHSPYAAFLGAIAYWHLGKTAEANAMLEKVRPELTAGTWQVDVMDFMQGRTNAEVLLSKAEDNEERTEAHTYIGIMAALAGRRDEAVDHLQWVRRNGTKTYVEYRMAETELEWLNSTAKTYAH